MATIFVFGSNLAGVHGAGAAKHAAVHHGAIRGIGIGRQGSSYAIPTKNRKIETLSLNAIRIFIGDFLKHAAAHPEDVFEVTQIGCGLAGYTAQEIAPMFRDAPPNCSFDTAWKPYLGENRQYWGHVA
jgi:hypothetical protein